MDTTNTPSQAPKTHTSDEVRAIIANHHATPSDYLIKTFFNINKTPLCDHHQRRFNNLIFNNFSKISKLLTTEVFHPKSLQTLRRDLHQLKYVSLIYFNPKQESCPVFLQFFDAQKGVEHCLLAYRDTGNLQTIFTEFDICEKVVGYCGSSLTLAGNRMISLPYSDGFLKVLFNFLMEYLPEDLICSLVKLGETVVGMNDNSLVARLLSSKYRGCLGSNQHILSSDYVRYVVENYSAINAYLLPFHCLPYSITTLLSSVLHRFLLFFMSEIYRKLDAIHFVDNSAVTYFFYLVKVRDTLIGWLEDNYIPLKASQSLTTEIDFLVEVHEVNPNYEKPKLDELFKEANKLIKCVYTEAVKHVTSLLNQFYNFETLEWVLLDTPIKFEQVHHAYHTFIGTCENSEQLREEVKFVNFVIPKVALPEVDSVAAKWVMLLKEVPEVPMLEELLHYLLSLPASYTVMDAGECQYENMIRMNLKSEKLEESYMDLAEELITKNQVPRLID